MTVFGTVFGTEFGTVFGTIVWDYCLCTFSGQVCWESFRDRFFGQFVGYLLGQFSYSFWKVEGQFFGQLCVQFWRHL